MSWKKVELRVLRWFGTERLGPVGAHGPDGLTDTLSIEIKHRSSLPKWFLSAYEQPQPTNGEMPVTILTLKDNGQRLALTEIDFLLGMLERAGLAQVDKDFRTASEELAIAEIDRPRLPAWMAEGIAQAIHGAEGHRLPIAVFHLKGKHSYQTAMPLADFVFLLQVGGIQCPDIKEPLHFPRI